MNARKPKGSGTWIAWFVVLVVVALLAVIAYFLLPTTWFNQSLEQKTASEDKSLLENLQKRENERLEREALKAYHAELAWRMLAEDDRVRKEVLEMRKKELALKRSKSTTATSRPSSTAKPTSKPTPLTAAKEPTKVAWVNPYAWPADAKVLRWKKVGGDPCNPNAGCTLAWALPKTGWPSKVQTEFLRMVREEHPTTFVMTSDMDLWMTFGYYSPKFEMYTRTDWPKGHTEISNRWTQDHDGLRYHLVRVAKCQNWGGYVEVISKPRTSEPTPPGMPLDPLPQVACL